MSLSGRLAAVGLAGLISLSAGCAMDFQVSAPGVKESVEVHLVGVNQGQLNQWLNYSMTKYWSPGDPFRAAAEKSGIAHRMVFPDANGQPFQVLKGDDPIHQIWKDRQVEYVLVLAHLPGLDSKDDKPADLDPRRLVLWLDPGKWSDSFWGKRTVIIQITPANMTYLGKMAPVNK